MKLEEAIKQLKDLKKDMKKDTKGSEGIFKQDVQAIETVLQQLEHLQKENEELKEHNRKYLEAEIFSAKQIKEIEKQRNEHYIHKDKIREKIEDITDKYNRIYKFPSPKVEETPEGQLIYKIRFNTDSEALRIVKVILEDLLKEE